MQRAIAGVALVGMFASILTGCQDARLERIISLDGVSVRTMMRGNVAHGWEVWIPGSGVQQWVYWEDGQHVAGLVLDSEGRVCEACYEGEDYFMEIRSFKPGEPLGNRGLELLSEVRAEARRRQILLPEEISVQRQIASSN